MYYKLKAKIKTKDGKEETVFNGNGLTEAMVIGAMEKLNPMYGGALLNVEIGQQSENFIFSDDKGNILFILFLDMLLDDKYLSL